MARQYNRRITQRPQVDITEPSVITQVNAQPVDTTVRQPFIAPQRKEPKQYTELRQLALGLGSLSEGLQQFGNAQAQIDLRQYEILLKKQREEEIRRAELMAQAFKGTPAQALAALSPESSPIFQEAYTAQLGAKYGLEAQQAFAQYAAENYDNNNNDPRVARAFAEVFFDEYIKGVTDERFLQAYRDKTVKTITDFVNGAIIENIEQVEDNKQGMLMTKAMSYFTDPKRPESWLDDLKAEFSKLNMRRGDIEQQVFQAAATYAVQNGDPALLEAFIKPTADGLPGYALRGGDNAAAWQQAMARAQKALEEGMQINTDGIRALTQNSYYDLIQSYKTGVTPMPEPEQFEQALLKDFQEGNLKGSDIHSIYKQFSSVYWEHKETERLVPLAIDGRIASSGISKDKLGTVLDKAATKQVIALGQTGDPDAFDKARLRVAKTNGVIHPEHEKILTDAALMPVSKAEGKEQMPDRVKQALTLAYSYYNDKNGRDNFIANIGDKRVSGFWSNLFDRAQHNGHNLEAAYLFAKEVPVNKQDWTKVDSAKIKSLVDEAISKLQARGGWLSKIPVIGGIFDVSGKAFAENPYVRTWIEEEIKEHLAIDPNAPFDSVVSNAASRFIGSHRMINVDGHKQIIDISHLPIRPTDDDMADFEKGLSVYKRVFLHDSGLKDFYDIKDEDLDNHTISLKPVPQSVRGDTGAGNYLVLIDGIPTGFTIDFEAFLKQARNKGYINAETIGAARELLGRIDSIAKDQIEIPLEEFDRLPEELDHYHNLGLITSNQYSKASDILKDKSSSVKAQRLLQIENERLQETLNSPVKNLLNEPKSIDVMHSTLPHHPDPTSQMAPVLIDRYMGDKDYGKALGIAVFGTSNISYVDESGKTRIGMGYNLDGKYIKDDFSRSGLLTSFIGLTNDKRIVLKDLKNGTKRLNRQQVEALFDLEYERAYRRAEALIGEGNFNILTENAKAALTVLGMTIDEPQNRQKAMEFLKTENWEGIESLMTEVPKSRRKSALGFIRAMAAKPSLFQYLAKKK